MALYRLGQFIVCGAGRFYRHISVENRLNGRCIQRQYREFYARLIHVGNSLVIEIQDVIRKLIPAARLSRKRLGLPERLRNRHVFFESDFALHSLQPDLKFSEYGYLECTDFDETGAIFFLSPLESTIEA